MDLQELIEYCHGPLTVSKLSCPAVAVAVASSLDTRRSASGVTLCTRDTWPALKYTSLGPPHQRLEFQCCVVVLGYHRDSNGPPGGSEAQPREAKHCPRSRRTASPSLAGEGQGYLKEPDPSHLNRRPNDRQRPPVHTCSRITYLYQKLRVTKPSAWANFGHMKKPLERRDGKRPGASQEIGGWEDGGT